MLIRTSSGSTSVGHLALAAPGFSALHRPDVSFACGGLLFPVGFAAPTALPLCSSPRASSSPPLGCECCPAT